MKIEKIKIIKQTFDKSQSKVNQCSLCDLDGFCLETNINCLESEYYIIDDQEKELTKYEFEEIEVKEENDEIE